jgi:hypothetical protein
MKLRILIAGLVFSVAALAAESGAELFQKAVTEERASGNLEESSYTSGSPRSLRRTVRSRPKR